MDAHGYGTGPLPYPPVSRWRLCRRRHLVVPVPVPVDDALLREQLRRGTGVLKGCPPPRRLRPHNS